MYLMCAQLKLYDTLQKESANILSTQNVCTKLLNIRTSSETLFVMNPESTVRGNRYSFI